MIQCGHLGILCRAHDMDGSPYLTSFERKDEKKMMKGAMV